MAELCITLVLEVCCRLVCEIICTSNFDCCNTPRDDNKQILTSNDNQKV